MAWIEFFLAQLWQHVWAVIPIALVAAVVGRVLRCGPVTRHAIWVVVLVWFVVPPLLPPAPTARWLREAEREPGAADWTPDRVEPVDVAVPAADPLVRGGRSGSSRTLLADLRLQNRTDFEVGSARVRPVRVPPADEVGTGSSSRAMLPPNAAGPAIPTPTPPVRPADAIATRSEAAPTAEIEPAVVRAPEPPAASARVSFLRSWLAAAALVRTTLSDLPAIPLKFWLGGAALVLLWRALGVALFLHRVRTGKPPPPWVLVETRRMARGLGLARLPAVCMVDARIPPMVWCGWRPTLVLPRELWRTLDAAGRCAVLCHELAHLRRRDHWVHRLEAVVGVLFWWHPVAWWARQRIAEEADNCCDAWVTWLMPRERRAYAEALLKTRVFVDKTSQATPPLGAAVISPGAKRLARRLTMVMTQSVPPRQSLRGVALSLGVIGLSWLLSPAVSIAQNVGMPPPTEAVAPVAVPLFAPTAAGTPVAERQPPMERGDEAVARTYRLAAGKLEALTKLLVREDVPLKVRPLGNGIEVLATPRDHEMLAAFVREIDPQAGPKEWREYPLPAGKLELLYGLMSRDDVPILVSTEDGKLRAEATLPQHEIIKGFLALIHPAGKAAPTPKVRGRAQESRLGVPETPAPPELPAPPAKAPKAHAHGRGVGVGRAAPATPLPPMPPTPPAAPAPAVAPPPLQPAPRALFTPAPAAGSAARRAYQEALRGHLDGLRRHAEEQRAQSREHARALREQARAVAQQSAQLEAEVAHLQAEAERQEQAAFGLKGAAGQKQVERNVRQLEKSTRQLERELERLNELSEGFDERADEVESQQDDWEAQFEDYTSQLAEPAEEEEEEEESDEADTDDEAEASRSDYLVSAGSAHAYAPRATTYGGTWTSGPTVSVSPLGEAIYITTPGLPVLVQQRVDHAVRAGVHAHVRSAVRNAMAALKNTGALDDEALEALTESLNEAIATAVSQSLSQICVTGQTPAPTVPECQPQPERSPLP